MTVLNIQLTVRLCKQKFRGRMLLLYILMNMLKHFCNVRRAIQVVLKLCNANCVIWMCVISQKHMLNRILCTYGKDLVLTSLCLHYFFRFIHFYLLLSVPNLLNTVKFNQNVISIARFVAAALVGSLDKNTLFSK